MIGLLAFASVAAAATHDTLPLQAMQNFGTCIVSFTPRGAREVLELDYNSSAYDRRLRALLDGHRRCAIGSSIGSSRLLFAGSLAEALLKNQVRPAEMPQRLSFDPAQGTIQARSPTEAMALCTVIAAPAPASALLRTDPGSAEEKAALQPIIPLMNNCAQENMKLTANRPAVRALLALAAWRVVSAPRRIAAAGASQGARN